MESLKEEDARVLPRLSPKKCVRIRVAAVAVLDAKGREGSLLVALVMVNVLKPDRQSICSLDVDVHGFPQAVQVQDRLTLPHLVLLLGKNVRCLVITRRLERQTEV